MPTPWRVFYFLFFGGEGLISFIQGAALQMSLPSCPAPCGSEGLGHLVGGAGSFARQGNSCCPWKGGTASETGGQGRADAHEPPCSGHRAPGPLSSLQSSVYCLPRVSSIYSTIFLAPSARQPDSQLMPGTHRACLPRSMPRAAVASSRLLHLKMPLLPLEAQLMEGVWPQASHPDNPLRLGIGVGISFSGTVNAST